MAGNPGRQKIGTSSSKLQKSAPIRAEQTECSEKRSWLPWAARGFLCAAGGAAVAVLASLRLAAPPEAEGGADAFALVNPSSPEVLAQQEQVRRLRLKLGSSRA
ncbi:unnamed protein product, partial [Polarella glacialis]